MALPLCVVRWLRSARTWIALGIFAPLRMLVMSWTMLNEAITQEAACGVRVDAVRLERVEGVLGGSAAASCAGHSRAFSAYNLHMLRRRTHLSLCIAVGSTLILTTVAAVALCWPS